MTTPGPWIIDGVVPDKLGFQGWLCTPTGPLGRMEPVCHIEAVSAADVKLIAAAPDLVEALKPFSRMFLYPDDIEGHEDSDSGEHEELMVSRAHIRAARAALSKAGL